MIETTNHLTNQEIGDHKDYNNENGKGYICVLVRLISFHSFKLLEDRITRIYANER